MQVIFLFASCAKSIKSAIISELNKMQIYNIDICDKLGNNDKWLNLRNLIFKSYIEFDEFKNLIELEKTELNYNFIFYTGEILDEQESDLSIMINDDLRFAFKLLNKCIISKKFCKFINASTTNIYDDANMPFSDDEKFIKRRVFIKKTVYYKDIEYFKNETCWNPGHRHRRKPYLYKNGFFTLINGKKIEFDISCSSKEFMKMWRKIKRANPKAKLIELPM